MTTPKMTRISRQGWVVLVTIAFVACYGLFEAHMLVQGPSISISLPKDMPLSEALVTVAGETKNATWIGLLGKQIHVNEQGQFREQLLVPVGYSILTLEARDRFGRSTTKKVEIVRKAPENPLEVLTNASSSPITPS